MRRSIRWSLIGWFGLLLAGVLVAFGGVLVATVSRQAMATVDGTLATRARLLAGALDFESDADDEHRGWDLEVSPQYLDEITREGWVRIWDADGTVILAHGAPGAPARPTGLAGPHTFDGRLRGLEVDGPRGVRVLVATDCTREQRQAWVLLATVIGAGTGVLAVALLGGWWIARRSVAPIGRMAGTAAGITERDLATRLDVTDVPDELRGLAASFNAMLDRLEAAFAQQARFTADASHELRTPVTIIRTQAEVALKRERPADEYRATLEACLRAAERMSGTVEGLLTLARADAGAAVNTAQPVALAPLVAAAAALLQESAAAAGVTLATDVADDCTVRGDPTLLAEVVQNLLTNGVRYNRPGGRVAVSAKREGAGVALEVTDTGIGIAPAALPHLFERFYRVDPARSRAQGGSGLGLAIVHWIVQVHGGTIDVQSRPGEGSTFTVRLGAWATPAPAAP